MKESWFGKSAAGKAVRPFWSVFQDKNKRKDVLSGGKGTIRDSYSGHPVDTLMQENRYAELILRDMKKLIRRLPHEHFQGDWNQLSNLANDLQEIEIHYRRIEEILFPYLEKSNIARLDADFSKRYQEVLRLLRNFSQSVKTRNFNTLNKLYAELSDLMKQLITDEDQILFPTALSFLSPDTWAMIRKKSVGIGYAWMDKSAASLSAGEKTDSPVLDGFHLDHGYLSLDMIESLLNTVLSELTVFDATGVVIYYNRSAHRLFPRKPDLIGKPLKEAFSGKTYSHIKKILSLLKSGKQPYVEFRLVENGKEIYTKYAPLFNREGHYCGTVEMVVDVTEMKRKQGAYSNTD